MEVRLSGAVKWYNTEKGYGFLVVEGQTRDVFFHAKQWHASGYTAPPVEGEMLTFSLGNGPKGMFATKITRNGETPNASTNTANQSREAIGGQTSDARV